MLFSILSSHLTWHFCSTDHSKSPFLLGTLSLHVFYTLLVFLLGQWFSSVSLVSPSSSLQLLNVGGLQGLVLIPLVSLTSFHFLGYFIQSHRFINHLLTNYFPILSWSSNTFLELQTCISNCLLNISIWLSNWHIKFNIYKCNFFYLSPPNLLFLMTVNGSTCFQLLRSNSRVSLISLSLLNYT